MGITRTQTALVGLTALALVVGVTTFGCARAAQPAAHSAVVAASPSPEPPGLAGAAAVNAFGFDLMRARIASESTATPNLVLSPLSVHAALSMTLQGAAGTTAEEMRRTLHVPGDADAAASTYSLLLAALKDRSKEQTLTVANALWIRQGLPVKNEFLNANRLGFGASAQTLDFARDDVAGTVNEWVAENTQGMIPQIIDKVDPSAVMLLTNAVYFKARWSNEFYPDLTERRPFQAAPKTLINVPTMHATMELPIVKGGGFSATRLDYRGGDSAAYVILPDRSRRLDDVLSGLTASDFAALRKRLDSTQPTRTALALPKFDAAVGGEFGPTVAAMGMPNAFDPDRADFSNMVTLAPDQHLWIERLIHKARMKFDEQGTEAAASTLSMVCGAAMMPSKPVPFVCDRPFGVAIVDTQSGALLFLAAIHDPSKN